VTLGPLAAVRERPLVKKVRRYRRRLLSQTLAEGALTRHLISRYCEGHGLEIAPGPGGGRTYAPPSALFVDRFAAFDGAPTAVNVLADAAALPFASGRFDYLVSAHCLEHCPDTLAALREWGRVVRPEGSVVVILPHAARTFDRGRILATLDHHLSELDQEPKGLSHFSDFEEMVARHGEPDWAGHDSHNPDGSWNQEWIARSGYWHYHCWTQDEMVEVVRWLGWRVLAVLDELPERRNSFLVAAATR
jgi:SAM-dependent methyltransferase